MVIILARAAVRVCMLAPILPLWRKSVRTGWMVAAGLTGTRRLMATLRKIDPLWVEAPWRRIWSRPKPQ